MIQTVQNYLNKSNDKQARLRETMFAGFRPLFCFLRITGLTAFSIDCNSNGEVQSSKVKVVDVVWFTIAICVCMSLAILNYNQIHPSINHQYQIATIFLNVGSSIISMLTCIFFVLFYSINMYNRQIFIDILRNFEQFDKEVSLNILYKSIYDVFNCHIFLCRCWP